MHWVENRKKPNEPGRKFYFLFNSKDLDDSADLRFFLSDRLGNFVPLDSRLTLQIRTGEKASSSVAIYAFDKIPQSSTVNKTMDTSFSSRRGFLSKDYDESLKRSDSFFYYTFFSNVKTLSGSLICFRILQNVVFLIEDRKTFITFPCGIIISRCAMSVRGLLRYRWTFFPSLCRT